MQQHVAAVRSTMQQHDAADRYTRRPRLFFVSDRARGRFELLRLVEAGVMQRHFARGVDWFTPHHK